LCYVGAKAPTPNKQILERAGLFNEEEGAEGEGVDASAVEAADGAARIGDERLAE